LSLYARRGLIIKKDNVVSERIENIQTLNFKERGISPKKGIIKVVTGKEIVI